MRLRLSGWLRLFGSLAVLSCTLMMAGASPARASTQIIGSGSSFAGIEFQEWSKDVASPPYSLNVNYQSSSSGQGRQDFKDKTVDFAVTDIRYDPPYDVDPPNPSTFEYVPVTAGGISFMYNLVKQGFTASAKPINLSSLTVCAIFAGSVPFWDDPHIEADNPGVALPHVPITPVVRNDPAGTNFVLEEYCIALHNEIYMPFAAAVTKSTGTDYPDSPTSNWPILTPIIGASGSDGVAATVAGVNNDGYITAVETGYATERGFPVAAVRNDTGNYVLPTPNAVATALSFAQQQPDGTHNLDFTPGNAAAYNPSTYSYMLLPLTGIDPSKGAALTEFADYCLTVGQSIAPELTYASIGRSLIMFGLSRIQAVPGYVGPTAAETATIPASAAVPAGGGGTTLTNPKTGATTQASTTKTASSSSKANTSTGAAASAGTGASTGADSSGVASSGNSAAASGAGVVVVDPAASLDSATGALGRTGIDSALVATVGLALVVAGEMLSRANRRLRSRS